MWRLIISVMYICLITRPCQCRSKKKTLIKEQLDILETRFEAATGHLDWKIKQLERQLDEERSKTDNIETRLNATLAELEGLTSQHGTPSSTEGMREISDEFQASISILERAFGQEKKPLKKLHKRLDAVEDQIVELTNGPVVPDEKGELEGKVEEKGDRGQQGNDGTPGEKGEQGSTGNQVLKGSKGEKEGTELEGLTSQPGIPSIVHELQVSMSILKRASMKEKITLKEMHERLDALEDQSEKGERGEPGIEGRVGEKGDRGTHGNDGTPGDNGEQGPQGIQGFKGSKGEKGDPVRGEQGGRGEPGIEGRVGEKGDRGPHGNVGTPGDKGAQGSQGIQGFKGSKGEKGDPAGCSPPNIDVILPEENDVFLYAPGQQISGMNCRPGYELVGDTVLICKGNDSWHGIASCVHPCGGLPDKPEGGIWEAESYIIDITAILKCDDTFIRSTDQDSEATIRCEANGKWTSVEATCQKISGFDCKDVKEKEGNPASGVYNIRLPRSQAVIKVFCDMDTDGGGWTVFQNRFNGLVEFYRNMSEYENGFGEINGEFWLGLKYIEELSTYCSEVDVRINLEKSDGTAGYGTHNNFSLSPAPLYKLHLDRGTGTLGDHGLGMSNTNGANFCTFDHDDSNGYAVMFHGAWWYDAGTFVNLNGDYAHPPGSESSYGGGAGGMYHFEFDYWRSLKSSKMMMRRHTSRQC